MKLDLSRNRHSPEQRYRAVLQQQGRVITDADWSEAQQSQSDLRAQLGAGGARGADNCGLAQGERIIEPEGGCRAGAQRRERHGEKQAHHDRQGPRQK